MKRIHNQLLQIVLAAAACGGATASASAQDAAGEPSSGPDIVMRSPFLPPGFSPPEAGKAQPAKAAAGGYEFRGVYQLGDEYRFLVSPPRSRSGAWVQLGKSYEEYEVRSYDAASETLTLFFNNSETQLALADLESNPTPTPVSGQVQSPTAVAGAAPAAPQPVRRTIRPATRSGDSGSPPPPAWLEKLREEAASRRAQAAQSRMSGTGSGVSATGNPSGSDIPLGPGDMHIPAPPDMPPPTPPPNLSEIDIPPPPTELPPPPPPEVMRQIQQSISFTPPSG